jgi:uncharacterized protein YcnI
VIVDLAVVLTIASPLAPLAPLHVEPQSAEAPAGSRTTFSFVVEHGCDGSATVEVAIQLPAGAFDVVPMAPAGWSGAVEQGDQPVVRFTGGPLPDDVEQAFGFELVTPNTPGQVALFPTVQVCEVGEIAWIDPADQSEEPAPRILLTENAQPILPTTTTATSAPPTTEAPATTSEAAAAPTDEGDEDGDSGAIPLVVAAAAVAAAAGVGLTAARRRRARDGATTD